MGNVPKLAYVRKPKIKMKKYLLAVVLVVSTLTAFAATNSYRADEFSFGAYGVYQVAGQKGGDVWGAGVEAAFFPFNKYVGVALATDKDRVDSGGFFQNLTLGPVVRFPIRDYKLAPFVTGGVGFDFDNRNDRYYYAGGGLEYRWTKHLANVLDARYIFRDDDRAVKYLADGSTVLRFGFRWAF